MNCTNYTIKKPVYICEQSSSGLDLPRFIAYLVFSGLQFIGTVAQIGVAVAIAWWVNKKIRGKDRDEERERLDKEKRDKIVDIVDNEVNKIVEAGIKKDLKECEAKFRAMVMFHGSEAEITGLDVLRFMLLNSNHFESKPLRKLQEHLDTVVRLFRTLHSKLRLYVEGDHVCPENTKKELGPLVADVGEIARCFVSGTKLKTISSVLEYFGNEERDEYDSSKMEGFFPYLNDLRFGETSLEAQELLQYGLDLAKLLERTSHNDQDFSFDISKALKNPKRNYIKHRIPTMQRRKNH